MIAKLKDPDVRKGFSTVVAGFLLMLVSKFMNKISA